MSYHARPLRVPAGTPAVSTGLPSDPPVASTEPVARPMPPAQASPPAPSSAPEPAASVVPPVPPPAVSDAPTSAPWYRREAWLLVSLAGFLPLLLALVVPQSLRVPLIAVAGLLIACGTVMLARRGAP